jgi:hypothetical protein
VYDHVPEKKGGPTIRIESLEVTDKTLTLDYQVSNPFEDDIWVCENSCLFHCEKEAGTRIDADTLWIIRRTKSKRDTLLLLADTRGVARYLRLKPGEFHSWRIVLDLPIVQFPYGVFSKTEELAKKRKQVILHRAIFEIGYFPPRHNRFFVDASAEGKKVMGIQDGDMSVVSPDFGLGIDPYVVDEIHEGRLHKVLYISDHSPSQEKEESAKVLITDVNIPCSVLMEDE